MQRLVALKTFAHSVGTVKAGDQFLIGDSQAGELIKQKLAVPLSHAYLSWDGLNWKDATVVVIASGESLTQEDCDLVKVWRDGGQDRKVVVINTSFRLASWADVLYGCDLRWWRKHHKEVNLAFHGELWSQDEPAKQYGAKHIRSERGEGLCLKPGVIYQGGNSGYQAIGFAYQAGAKRIVLLGMDMQQRELSHWHGEHPEGLRTRMKFDEWIPLFDPLALDLKKSGVEVVNATRDSALKCFPKKTLEEALGDSAMSDQKPAALSARSISQGVEAGRLHSGSRIPDQPSRSIGCLE